MRLTDLFESALTFRNEVFDFHHGQMDAALFAKLDGETVGRLTYAVYDGEPSVRMLEVSSKHRRKGIGKALLRKLQSDHPGVEINLGMLTDDGSALISSMQFRDEPNDDVIAMQKRLPEIEKEIADLTAKIEANPQLIRDDPSLGDRFNELSDEQYDIEQALWGKKSHRRIIEGEELGRIIRAIGDVG